MDCGDGIVYFSAPAGGTLEDYAKGKIKALPWQAANHLVNEGIKNAFPEIIFRGGVNLEDGAKYRSSEFDMFIPVRGNNIVFTLWPAWLS